MSFYGLSGLQYYLSAKCCSLGLALESDQHRMILLPPALRVHLIDQCPIGLPRHRTCARPTGIDSHVCPMKIIASSARCSTTRLAGQRSLLVAVIRHRRDSHKVDPRWQDASRHARVLVFILLFPVPIDAGSAHHPQSVFDAFTLHQPCPAFWKTGRRQHERRFRGNISCRGAV